MKKNTTFLLFAIVFFVFSIFVFPNSVSATNDWLNGPLGSYYEKLNDKYLQQRMSEEQIEKNTKAYLRDYLTTEDLELLTNPKLAELLSFPTLYNGKEILFHGEAIGQPLTRKEYGWINVMDEDGNSIGCWMSSKFIDEVSVYGRYGFIGDILLVKGIYHVANEKHGGETEIEVNDIMVLKKGRKVPPEEINVTFAYIIFAIALGILWFYIARKRSNAEEEFTSGGGIFFGSKDNK
ncbi:MAG: hypothetical protein KAH01_04065 [Caldisericia bacterium]|nr:hypothetical protein [Caldisericia bacterium]